MKKRPAMYLFGGGTYINLRNYLLGLRQGFENLGYGGLEPEWGFKREVELERGWDANSNADSDRYMRRAGLSETEIFVEYLEIIIEMWKRTLKQMKDVALMYNQAGNENAIH
jgi:hypothetical protein